MSNETSKRKLDHINACLKEDVESHYKTTGFENIDLVHQACPGIRLEDVDVESSFLGKKLDAPIMICPMTGGHKKGKEINLALAEAAQELNITFSVGSQRAAIENPDLIETYQVREAAPDILLFGNLGVTQINLDYGAEEVKKAIKMIEADGLGIHLNPLQEAIQPEGDAVFRETMQSISEIISKVKEPIYVKETGGGINKSTATDLVEAGAKAIDVSGVGGTSWAGVEALREESRGKLGEVFWDWGIPTSVSTAEVSEAVDVPVISSGGIRTGIDAAKAIALGADLVGIGLPLFRASVQGKGKVTEWLEEFILELKTAMFLTGCSKIKELQKAPLIISGQTREWFESRGLKPEKFGDQ
ncbi:isopentenyl pyrophosphate isomerase [candidate division MSBL1 archaeon SCGC-AAA259I09]|uniref:Isopentenyl-diphosphate delta-isomerase n=1 Tax=candidate division MSBL1 archaeon SCGC-AAA259I09 TaxID=1698267 RepID=A0A133UUZ9_9EURY|nr:isopentenyl pyrophosphate isomerase [candidate division MSBL1 archaeon SCGC-AAA259I09]